MAATASSTSFETRRATQKGLVENAVRSTQTAEQFQKALTATLGDGEVHDKPLLELAFREVLEGQIRSAGGGSIETPVVEKLISLGRWCSEHKLLDEAAVVRFLEDILDCQTIKGCERIFPFVERNLQLVIKSPSLFVTRTKFALLKICNMLKNRLSKTTNTAFCGQVSLLLAKSLPLSEPSGLNISGAFNPNNNTSIQPDDSSSNEGSSKGGSSKADGGESSMMEVEAKGDKKKEDDEEGAGVDYAFYKSVWNLQQFFQNPATLTDKCDEFVQTLSALLEVFEGSKVEHVAESASEPDTYYPKFLTGIRLLSLQLEDANFRRTVLTQCFLLFSFVNMEVAKKAAQRMQPRLNLSEKNKLKAVQKRVEKLLIVTPPNGADYFQRLEKLAKREKYWSLWKDNKCKFLKNEDADMSQGTKISVKEVRKQPEPRGKFLFRPNRSKRLAMGDPILEKCWTAFGGDLEECEDEERKFTPDLKAHLKSLYNEEKRNGGTASSRRLNKIYTFRALRMMRRTDMRRFVGAKGSLINVDVQEIITGVKTVKKKETTVKRKNSPGPSAKKPAPPSSKGGDDSASAAAQQPKSKKMKASNPSSTSTKEQVATSESSKERRTPAASPEGGSGKRKIRSGAAADEKAAPAVERRGGKGGSSAPKDRAAVSKSSKGGGGSRPRIKREAPKDPDDRPKKKPRGRNLD